MTEGANVEGNVGDEAGSSPLHKACAEGNLEDVLDLLARCDIEQVNARDGEDGPSPLDLASRRGHVGVMQALLNAQADVNLADSEGAPTSLGAAIAGEQCEAIRVLVDAGGDIHARAWRTEYQPIHAACEIGSVQVLETLLKLGADRESLATSAPRRPINIAAKHGKIDVVVALLAAGSPVDYSCRHSRALTPLEDAAYGGHTAVAKTLLANGANVNGAGGGCTPLHAAAGANHVDVVDVLLQAGADPNPLAVGDLDTPLHQAVVELAHESAFALLKHGADVNLADDYGDTPLHNAARFTVGKKGSYDMLEILLRFGADQNAVNAAGYTALFYADFHLEDHIGFDWSKRPIRETDDYLTLLQDSPADRRWRRRGLVILGRAFPWKLRIGTPAQGLEGAAGGADTGCLPASRQSGTGPNGNTSSAAAAPPPPPPGETRLDGEDGAGFHELCRRSLADPDAMVRYMLKLQLEDPRNTDKSKFEVMANFLLHKDALRSHAMAKFEEILRTADPEEDVQDSDSAGGGGPGSERLSALPQTGAGDERDNETVSAVDGSSALDGSPQELCSDFRELVSSMQTMREEC